VSRYILRRLAQTPLVLWLLVSLSFFMMRFAPGGPFSAERRLDPVVEAALEAKFHLDKPLLQQYVLYLGNLLRGDLGPSLKHRSRTVNEIIAATLPTSLCLGAMAMLLAAALGCSVGIAAALHHNQWPDYGSMTCAVIGISLPTFVIGPLLQLFLSLRWAVLPLAGYRGIGEPVYLVLPALTLALPFAARIARLTRAGMLEVLNEDFIRTARAKGLAEHVVILRHALRGGLLPVVSYLGPASAMVMTGSLVVERIFQIPGLGREFVEGALNRDYTLVMGTVVVYGSLLIVCNLLVDFTYSLLDPRVRYA
jgi:oligopeptide transport system permease protein